MNNVFMIGNLTRDIELRYSQSGVAVGNTAIAVTRKFTVNGEKREEVCFTDITFFARSAEIANQYLRKGSKIAIQGRLNFDQWVDQNGQKRSKHSIVVEEMQMLDAKPVTQGAPAQQSPQYQAPAAPRQAPQYQAPQYQAPQYQAPAAPRQEPQYQAPAAQRQALQTPVIEIDEDEIPF